MKTRSLLPTLFAGFLALIGGCGEDDASATEATTTEATEVVETPEAVEPAEPAAPTPAVDSCSRLAACCRAFHTASQVPTSTCDGYDTLALRLQPEDCSSTIAGYRRTLERDGKPVPPVCQ